MRQIEVGKLFEEGKTKYQEFVKFDFDDSGALLFLFFNNPSTKEIESVKSGNLKLGLYEKDNILFLLFKFEDMEWMDAPYNAHLSKPFNMITPEPNQGYGMSVFLIDASTGILKVIRYVGWSNKMSMMFKDIVEVQRLALFDAKSYNEDINKIYGNYTTKDLVDRAKLF